MPRIKSFLLATLTLAAFLAPASAEQMSLSGTLKDANSGSSYNVTISPVVAPAPVPVTEPTPIPAPDPVVEPVASSTIPLTYTAPQFSGNSVAPSTTLASGGTIKNKTITDTGQAASIVTHGSATIDNVRVKSREGVRVGGGGTVTIQNSYVEVNGTGDDHADGVQAYAPGSRGVIKGRNSLIKCGMDSSTAGFFVADNWTGDVDLENFVFQGGPFGLRLHADKGGDINVSLKDVFFVGPFGYQPFYFLNYGGGKVVIKKWENVREATIKDGKLVPGKLIPKP